MAQKTEKYQVGATVTISISTEVEASSAEEALEIAEERPMQSFCHQCSSGDATREWIISGELDGTAENLNLNGD